MWIFSPLKASHIFAGKSGPVQLDSNGDRIGSYWLWSIPYKGVKYEKWGSVEMGDATQSHGVSGLDSAPSVPEIPVRSVTSATWFSTNFDCRTDAGVAAALLGKSDSKQPPARLAGLRLLQ